MSPIEKTRKSRIKRTSFTPLGELYYGAEQWVRLKIESEMLKELNVKSSSIRAYMVSTPAFRMRPDMKEIILRNLPEAKKCFQDTRITNPVSK